MSKKNKDLRTSPITALPGVVYDGIAGVVNGAVRMSPISFTDNRKDGEGLKKFAPPKSGVHFGTPLVNLKKQSGGKRRKRKTRRKRKSRRRRKTRRRRKSRRKRKTRRRRK